MRTPIPSRIACPSSRLAAPRTAAASRAAEPIATSGSKKDDPAAGRRERHGAPAVADRDRRRSRRGRSAAPSRWPRWGRPRRPPRGARARPRRARRRRARRRPPRPRPGARRPPPGVSSPSQPAPKTAAEHGHARRGRARARRRARAASASGLASPGSSPWASTSPPTSSRTTASQPQPAGRDGEALGHRRGARMRVDQDGGLAEQLGHPAPRRSGSRPGPRHPGPASATAACSGSAPVTSSRRRGPGSGSIGRRSQVRPPRTDGVPRRLGHRGGRQRADDVAAAADAQAQDPGGARGRSSCAVAVRRAPACGRRRRPRRSPRSPRRRGRTPRRRARACPRTGGRA